MAVRLLSRPHPAACSRGRRFHDASLSAAGGRVRDRGGGLRRRGRRGNSIARGRLYACPGHRTPLALAAWNRSSASSSASPPSLSACAADSPCSSSSSESSKEPPGRSSRRPSSSVLLALPGARLLDQGRSSILAWSAVLLAALGLL